MRKLTTGLLASYKAINSKYYAAKKARQEAAAKVGSSTNAASDYVMTAGDILGGRYKVTESIGKGSFGQVVSAEDIREGPTLGRKVAVKVIKAREAFRKQAKTEIKLLEALNTKDAENQWCIGALLPLAAKDAPPPLPPHTHTRRSAHLNRPSHPPPPQCASSSPLTTTATRASCLSTLASICTSYCGARTSRACR